MARKIDWGSVDSMLSRFSQFINQDTLAKKRSGYSMENFNKQLEGYARRDVLQHELDKKLEGAKNDFARELSMYEANIKIAESSGLKAKRSQANLARVDGNISMGERLDAEADLMEKELVKGAVMTATQVDSIPTEDLAKYFGGVVRGSATTDEASSLLKSGLTKATAKGAQELTGRGLDLDAGRLGVSQDTQALNREKYETEPDEADKQKKTRAMDFHKQVSDKISSVKSVLSGVPKQWKAKGVSPDELYDEETVLEWESFLGGNLTWEAMGKALSELEALDTKSLIAAGKGETLSPEDLDRIAGFLTLLGGGMPGGGGGGGAGGEDIETRKADLKIELMKLGKSEAEANAMVEAKYGIIK